MAMWYDAATVFFFFFSCFIDWELDKCLCKHASARVVRAFLSHLCTMANTVLKSNRTCIQWVDTLMRHTNTATTLCNHRLNNLLIYRQGKNLIYVIVAIELSDCETFHTSQSQTYVAIMQQYVLRSPRYRQTLKNEHKHTHRSKWLGSRKTGIAI